MTALPIAIGGTLDRPQVHPASQERK